MRQRHLQPVLDLKIPIATGASGLVIRVFLIPQNFSSTRELQDATVIEVHKHQARAGIDREVSQRVEHAVADVVGNADAPIIQNADKTRLTTAVRGINPVFGVCARDKQRVGGSNQRAFIVAQPDAAARRCRRH